MKILVTGAGGQLGAELCRRLAHSQYQVIAFTREEADLAQPQVLAEAVSAEAADWVINCAAYTAVDRAESEPEVAFAANRDGAAALATAVQGYGGRLLQVSTDFVFDGAQSHPYDEEDLPNPLGVYGQSKWDGEQAVRRTCPEALVVRTGWVHGTLGQNFVKTMLRLAAEREELRVVDDQVGTPSWTGDIADALIRLMERGATGLYHFSNEGVASWYDFAVAILEEARALGWELRAQGVRPIATTDYPTPARRPAYSVLSKQKIRPLLPGPIPHWRAGLRAMLKELST